MSFVAWLRRLLPRRLDNEDFDEEIRAHLAIAADEKVADGADSESARYAALKDFAIEDQNRETGGDEVDSSRFRKLAERVGFVRLRATRSGAISSCQRRHRAVARAEP